MSKNTQRKTKQVRISPPTPIPGFSGETIHPNASRLAIFLLLLLLVSVASAEINVACAANMRFAMSEIVEIYQKKTGKVVKPIFASSGKLSAQILNGAPFDLFVSADMGFADSLVAKNFAQGPTKEYARGKVVLWTMKDYDLSKGVAILKSPDVKTIAVGDPKLTVYGPA
ncbi:MAG TPA: molybdate ABC transporter substrate-binding protein, partial [Fibrobacteraceae bacterium]|nr:molybdate ABC transporter substrate-binding protein [Fibrobacteraceae bacterium]